MKNYEYIQKTAQSFSDRNKLNQEQTIALKEFLIEEKKKSFIYGVKTKAKAG